MADPAGTLRSLTGGTRGIAEALAAGFSPASPTPLNPEIGPHRRFDWLATDLPVIKDVKNRFGGTVNDVVLALVSGGIRRFLRNRGLRPETLDFRAMIPVNTRDESELGAMGNKVAMMVARLPIGEADPRRRLELVCELTGRLKESGQARGVRRLEEIGDSTFPSMLAAFARLATRARPYNIVVTNLPGPQFPVYLLGTPMRAVYPLVPLSRNQALGIAIFSYNGRLFWGFNSDWDAVPDLHDLVNGIQRELDILTSAAGRSEAEPPPPAPEPPPKPRRRRKER
jgi:WS/DGAT/MGAT family acyltransferase